MNRRGFLGAMLVAPAVAAAMLGTAEKPDPNVIMFRGTPIRYGTLRPWQLQYATQSCRWSGARYNKSNLPRGMGKAGFYGGKLKENLVQLEAWQHAQLDSATFGVSAIVIEA